LLSAAAVAPQGLRRMRTPDDIALKDQYLDLRGLARYSALSVGTLRAHIREGQLPAYRVRGKVLVRRSEFDRWLERYRLKRAQDLEAIADEVLTEIGLADRRSRRIRA
jgi:excisionase family DNA binding protein